MDLVSLRIDAAEVERALGDIENGVPKVLVRVLNRSLSEVRTIVKRGIAADTGLPAGQVDRSLEEEKATFYKLVAKLRATGRRLPLTAFKARPTRKGVTYSIGAKGRTLALSAFIATVRSSRQAELGFTGHEGVFRRRGSFPALVGRLPIDELKGPSLPRVLANQWVAQGWAARGQEIVDKNTAHEVAFLLSRAGKGGVAA